MSSANVTGTNADVAAAVARVNEFVDTANRFLAQLQPAEPKGLGAVVRDRDGDLWVRSHIMHRDAPWTLPTAGGTYKYADIDVVEILSEGVTL